MPVRPVIVPPTAYAGGYGQLTTTFVTSLLPIVPLPLLTVQVWSGVCGWAAIVTL